MLSLISIIHFNLQVVHIDTMGDDRSEYKAKVSLKVKLTLITSSKRDKKIDHPTSKPSFQIKRESVDLSEKMLENTYQ